jgi:hypothetical protein
MAGINDYSNTPSLNTTINTIDVDEGCNPANINDAIRQLMADIADVDDGVVPLQTPDINGGTIDGASLGASSPITSAVISGDLTVDTDTLYVDSANNHIGVGTTSPAQIVHINEAITGSVRLRIENSEGFGEFSTDGDAVQLRNQTGIILNSVSAGDTQIRDGSASVKMTVTSSGTQFNDAIFLGGTGSANELNDYEEGTWTPSFEFAAAQPTAGNTTGTGFYTKVGNMVTVWGAVADANVTGASGDVRIRDLPFTSKASANLVGWMGSFSVGGNTTFSGYLNCDVQDGQDYIRPIENVSGAGSRDILNVANCVDGATDVYFCVSYQVN